MDRHSDTNRRIMTEKEFNELVLELEKQGFKKQHQRLTGTKIFIITNLLVSRIMMWDVIIMSSYSYCMIGDDFPLRYWRFLE